MDILYLLVPFSLLFLALTIKLLFWAINNGQYDDLDTEAQRILFEEDKVQAKPDRLSANGSLHNSSLNSEPDVIADRQNNDD
ncbi:MAG: cbb3-type cytochrome oxidase maturation protein [Cellvibrionaceae bacterium]|jgi:cbb3-type cytochrome oxidase maturation protein